MAPSLYERLGGAAAVEAAVDVRFVSVAGSRLVDELP